MEEMTVRDFFFAVYPYLHPISHLAFYKVVNILLS